MFVFCLIYVLNIRTYEYLPPPPNYHIFRFSNNIKLLMYHLGLTNLVWLQSQLKAVVDREG